MMKLHDIIRGSFGPKNKNFRKWINANQKPEFLVKKSAKKTDTNPTDAHVTNTILTDIIFLKIEDRKILR